MPIFPRYFDEIHDFFAALRCLLLPWPFERISVFSVTLYRNACFPEIYWQNAHFLCDLLSKFAFSSLTSLTKFVRLKFFPEILSCNFHFSQALWWNSHFPLLFNEKLVFSGGVWQNYFFCDCFTKFKLFPQCFQKKCVFSMTVCRNLCFFCNNLIKFSFYCGLLAKFVIHIVFEILRRNSSVFRSPSWISYPPPPQSYNEICGEVSCDYLMKLCKTIKCYWYLHFSKLSITTLI